ncbi:TRAP transporter small permease [Azospirillum sp. ST 5-10]|uniref:TRAP transporter small permease n=1 Tax=unclassified Azospirillum TaxID=2630922 RepID=UPI003F49C48E
MFGRLFARLEEVLIALLLAGMTLLTFLQVVLRYGFNSGLLWALEATTYMFGWLVLIGISYGVRVSAHIGIDMVIKLVPPYARRLAGMAAVSLSMLYAALMAYGSYLYIDKLHTIGVEAQDIPVERWILDIILPIGFGLLFIRLGQVLLGILTGRREGFELADEAADLLREQGLTDREGEPQR